MNFKNFSNGNYLDIIQCAKKCNSLPHVTVPTDPAADGSLTLDNHSGLSHFNQIEKPHNIIIMSDQDVSGKQKNCCDL